MKPPQNEVWFSHIEAGALIIVVTAPYKAGGVIQKPYQYKMTCDAEQIDKIKALVEGRCWLRNINPRTERKRWKDEEALKQQAKSPRPRRRKEQPAAPLKQIHMFAHG